MMLPPSAVFCILLLSPGFRDAAPGADAAVRASHDRFSRMA
jgi:hypothetical protein